MSGASLKSALSRTWARLRGGELTPAKAGLSVALGLLVGVTPLWGLHFWIVLGVGLLLRLDVPVAYLAANISIPPLLPFITIAEIEVGSFVRTGAFVGINRHELASRGAASFLKDVWLGTLLIAPAAAAIGGALTYAALRLGGRGAPTAGERSGSDGPEIHHRVVERYRASSFGTRIYVSSKLASDPVSAAVVEVGGAAAGLGRVCDLGTGRGQLALLLLESGVATHVTGVDWDDGKVAEATRASEGLPASFSRGDVRTAALSDVDTVLLIDVLHYFAPDEQAALVRRAAQAARTRVIIRDLDPDRGWRSAVTRLQERITTGAKYNRGERVEARPIGALSKDLEAEGFTVEVRPCWGNTPFSNVLVVATRTRRTSTSTSTSTPTPTSTPTATPTSTPGISD